MVALSGAKLYFAVGVEFEKAWLPRIAAANPGMIIVHTERGIDKMPMAKYRRHDGEPGQHEEGAHGEVHSQRNGLDPHIWLSPPLVKFQARAMLAALKEADPAHESDYSTNFQRFMTEIDDLDAELKKMFAGKQGMRFLVFHPTWGYFAQAYGLEQVPIELEGKQPKPAHLKALVEQARESGTTVVFVQPQVSAKSAELVAREIGGKVVSADPLAEDWLANLRRVARVLEEALK
jgi:zinc transport system substrate-binding protein